MGVSLVEWGFWEAESASTTEKQQTQIISPVLHRKPNTRLRFLGYYCVFFSLIPVGGISMIFYDIDMVFLLENSPLITFHILETTSEIRPFPIVLGNF